MIVILLIALLSRGENASSLVRPIESTHLASGCGCVFWRATVPANGRQSATKIFFSEGSGRPALMNLGGKDIWLNLVTPGADDKWGQEPGDSAVIKYEACGYDVEIERKVALSDCPEGKDDCEYINMMGTIKVRTGRIHETVRFIGACGC